SNMSTQNVDTPILESNRAYALWAKDYPPVAHNPLMKAEERAVLSLIPGSLEGQKVLDAACGSGRYIRRALERGAAQVVGVDASKEMLERGEQEGVGVVAASFSDERREPQLVVGRLEELPLPDGWADLTICALAVGHTPHLTQALK